MKDGLHVCSSKIRIRQDAMINKLREQKVLKHNQCPETSNDATEAMNAHTVDPAHL